MDVAQLAVRRSGPEAFAVAFAPPDQDASAWQPTFTVRPTSGELGDLAQAMATCAQWFLGRGAASSPDALAPLGRLLARCFLPEPVRQALLRLLPEIPLLIVTDCAGYPWELLDPGDGLVMLRRPVGRRLEGPSTTTAPRESAPGAPALLIVANPTGDLDAGDREAEGILNMIDALPFYVRATGIFRAQASVPAVLKELASGGHSLVHISCHASFDSAAGGRQALRLSTGLLDAGRLGSSLAGGPLVFLNACGSAGALGTGGLVEALLQAGARACVGTLWPVSDLASAELSIAFYQALFRGQPVGEALLQARQAVRALTPDDPSYAAFVLFGDPLWRPVARPDTSSYLATVLVAEFRSAEESAETWLQRLSNVAAAAQRYGGRVWQMGLAGFMATFGVPGSEEDQAERAAGAALAIQEVAAGAKLVVGIGLETGTVVDRVAAAPGAGELLLGPAPVAALRLAREAPGSCVLVGLSLERLLAERGEWGTGENGARTLIGFKPAQAVPASLPLVGREQELSALQGHWQRCCERRQRQIVGLVGEAGIGKTCLLAALRREIGPVRWLASRCPSYLRVEPFSLLRALLCEALGLPPDAAPEAWRAALTPLVADTPDIALVEQVLGLQSPRLEERDAQEAEHRAQLLPVLKQVLTEVAATAPVVVAIDDAHQADEASLDMLSQLMDSLDSLPILWLAAYRREWLPVWTNKRRSHIIDLDELSPSDRIRLLDGLLPQAEEEPTREALLTRAGGNPLYLEELARAVRQGDDASALPGSLQLVVLARAAQARPQVRAVLDLAAVCSSPFPGELLGTVLAQSGDTGILGPALRELVERDFLLPAGRGYAFRHPLLEEAVYAGLPERQRQTWHRRLADAIAGRPDTSAAAVAWHRWRSVAAPDTHGAWQLVPAPFGPDYPAEVMTALLAAGAAARAQQANREALRWYERGLEIAAQICPVVPEAEMACHAGAGRALSRLGDFEAAATHLQAAFDLGEACPEAGGGALECADLARLIGRMRMRQGRYAEAVEQMARARTLAAQLEGSAAQGLLALIEAHTGAVHHWRGDTEGAVAGYQAAVDLARRLGSDPLPALAEAYNGLGVVLRGRGKLDEAQACYEHALSIWQALHEAYEAARVQDNLGTVHFYRGDWEMARECYERSLAFWERIEEQHHIPYSLLNLGGIHLNQGRWDAARVAYTRALELWETVQDARMPALAHVNLAHLALAQGEPAPARRHLDQALQSLDALGVDSFRAEAYAVYAELQLQENDAEGALTWAGRAVETAQRLSLPLEEGVARRVLGQALHRQGDLARALDELQRSEAILIPTADRLELARTWVACSAVEHALDQPAAAKGHVADAGAVFASLGARPDMAACLEGRT